MRPGSVIVLTEPTKDSTEEKKIGTVRYRTRIISSVSHNIKYSLV